MVVVEAESEGSFVAFLPRIEALLEDFERCGLLGESFRGLIEEPCDADDVCEWIWAVLEEP